MKKGENYKCIQDVVMDDDNILAYIEGKIYPCEVTDCLTDEQGDKLHSWDIDYWDNYFVLVEEDE